MADRQQPEPHEDARDVADETQREPSPRNQGDGMETAPTSNAGGASGASASAGNTSDGGASDGASGGERGREQEGDREGRGGYGNDTGFVGGTVGARDDQSDAQAR